jgi:hypothetical protein
MADTSGQSGISDWGNLLGAGAGALTNYFGNQSSTNAAAGGETNAINTQTGLQGDLSSIYGTQRGIGVQSDVALGRQLGLGGTPDYSAFQNSPGFQGSLALGNQAIQRSASANGSLYTPNMLNQLGQYDTTYASQNYNNYVNQLLQSAGLGAQGNAGLAQGYTSVGNNISQLQQNKGNIQAGGAANTTGIASNLLSKVPWGQVASGIGGMFSGSGGGSGGTSGAGPDTSQLYSQDNSYLNNTDFSGMPTDTSGGSNDPGNYWDSGSSNPS